MASEFGPSALATPANGISIGRLLAAPLFMLLVLHYGTSWVTVAAWFVLAGTDGIDGWVARRHGATRSGAFLDPLADKFLVLGALSALVAIERFSWVPVALIAGREITISLYRSMVARQGICVPARPLGKLKTLFQDLAVGAALLPWTGHDYHPDLAASLLWVAVALTIVSGAQYLIDGRRSRLADPTARAGAGAGAGGLATPPNPAGA